MDESQTAEKFIVGKDWNTETHSQPKSVRALEEPLPCDWSFLIIFCSNAYQREELGLGTNWRLV